MSALNFEGGRRRHASPAGLVARVVVVGAIALILSVYIWGVWPATVSPTTQPATVPAPPVRPIPMSLPALSDVDQTILAEARDGDVVRDRPFYYLLKRAAGARGRVEADALSVEAEALMAHPTTFRGRLVRLRGVFLREYGAEVPENLAGVREVRNGEIGTAGGTVITFVLPRARPTGARVSEDIELIGYFLQVRRFTSAQDGQSHTGPLVVGVSLRRLGRDEAVPVAWIVSLVGSVIVAVGAVAVVTVLHQRRAKRRRAAHTPRRPRIG